MAIHNTIEVMRINYGMVFGGFALVILAGFLFLVSIDKIRNMLFAVSCLILSIVIAGTGLYSILVANSPKFQKPTGKKQLEVTFIDDEIPVNFLDKYEVIEQRGEIFVLEEK